MNVNVSLASLQQSYIDSIWLHKHRITFDWPLFYPYIPSARPLPVAPIAYRGQSVGAHSVLKEKVARRAISSERVNFGCGAGAGQRYHLLRPDALTDTNRGACNEVSLFLSI